MVDRLYKPSKAYWKEVKELDNILFKRGSNDRRGFVGTFGRQRELEWHHNEMDFRYSAARAAVIFTEIEIPVGADLVQLQELPVGDIRSLDMGRVGLVRKVSYIASGVYGYGNHQVADHHYTFDLDQIDAGLTKSDINGLKLTARNARREQNRIGYSKPTEETFLFILDTLKNGEEETRFRE